MLLSQQQAGKGASDMHLHASALGCDTASKGDQWAAQQLAVDGEEVLGKVHLPQYLLLSRTLLTACLGEQTQVCWRLLCVWICCCLIGLEIDWKLQNLRENCSVQKSYCIRHAARCMAIIITARFEVGICVTSHSK